MTNNWDIPREEVVEIVIALLRRGYDIIYVVDYVTQEHYRGKSKAIARGILIRDALAAFYDRHGGLTEARERKHEQLSQMAETLRAEGWKLLSHAGGWLWRHTEAHVDVNNSGGLWKSFAEATERTFNSQTRQWLKDHGF